MGRPAKFTRDRILDAAAALAGEGGVASITMASIAGQLGGPVGSMYHRFPSRDLLLAALWLRTVGRFQEGLLTALAAGDLEAAALHTPRWCRAHPVEAALLVRHTGEALVPRWPMELAADREQVNSALLDALRSFADRRADIDYERTVFAIVDVPYGAVRRHLLADQAVPGHLDELIIATCRAVLALPPLDPGVGGDSAVPSASNP
ncbi:TetR/AcrR family transcriptional regulator [Nocardia sp. NPDC005978]|uniref:TetR/AcrR family transcriptional regulator n=1 Tax=Nocardia sp. NPDC005978 TaxID=3156725 RepID=UPI0033AF03A6